MVFEQVRDSTDGHKQSAWQGPMIPEKGQPGFIGKKLCSELGNVQLKIVPTNYELYKEIGTV